LLNFLLFATFSTKRTLTMPDLRRVAWRTPPAPQLVVSVSFIYLLP